MILTGLIPTLSGCSSDSSEPGAFDYAIPGYVKRPHLTDPPAQVPAPATDNSGGETPDGTPEPAYGYIYDKFNAHVIVESLDSYEGDPQQYDFIYNWFMGISMPCSTCSTSDSTAIFIDWEGESFYIYYPEFYFSIFGYNGIRWTFTHELTGERLLLDGLGLGYVGCPDESWNSSDFSTFHFEGTYDGFTNKFRGSYEWQEVTSDGACDKSCKGQMVVLLEG